MPFDPKSLMDLLPLLTSAAGNPQYRNSVMQAFTATKQRLDQEELLRHQSSRQDQAVQAEIENRKADNARADQMLQMQQGNADLGRLMHFRDAAGQQAQQIAQSADDPLAAQNELAAQSIGLRKDFGVPPSAQMPTPNMAGMISQRDKKRAADLYNEAEKRYGPEAMASDSITLKHPKFGDVKPSQLRQMFETPAVDAAGAPAQPQNPKRPRALQSKEMLVQGQPATVNFDPETGDYFDQAGAKTKVAPIPPRADTNPSQPGWTIQTITDPKTNQTRMVRVNSRTGEVQPVTLPEGTQPGGSRQTRLSPSQQDDLATMKTVEGLATDALTLGDRIQWKGVGGMGRGSIEQFATKNFGTGTEDEQGLRNMVGNIMGTIAKLRGGTSFTPNEQILLETYTPTINDSPKMIKSKLHSLQQFIASKRQNVLELAGAISPMASHEPSAAPKRIYYDAQGNPR